MRQHLSPKESPNAVSAPSYPPPPGSVQRIRAGSKNHADRLLSSLTLKGKSSKVPLAGQAIDALQDHTIQVLAQAPSANHNDAMVQPPAARRAASTGGIGLSGGSSRSTSYSPSPVTWEPNMPLPPPPPGPPPAAVRSQSLNRPMGSPSSGLARTLPLRSRRPPGTGSSLDTVPPTPAEWREEDGTEVPAPSRDHSYGPSPLHIDTGSILRKRRSGADYPLTATSAHPRRDSSAGGLFRSPAVRNRSAMGIRERRSESRNGKARAVENSAVEPSNSVAPWADDFQDVRPNDLILSASQVSASKQRPSAKSTTPNSSKRMPSLERALNSPDIQKPSGKAVPFTSSYTIPQPGSSRSQPFSADQTSTHSESPGRETLDPSTSASASPPSSLNTFSVPSPNRLSVATKTLSLIVPPGPEKRPISHLLHSSNPGDSMQVSLTPLTLEAPEPLGDLLGPESPSLFAGRAVERHRIFAEREAAAANDSQRLELFVQYITAESRIRREQYASVFEEDGIDVDELTQDLFVHSSLEKNLHDQQHSLSMQETSKRTSIASSEDDSSAVSRKYESPSSATTNSSTQQRPESAFWKDYVPVLSPIAASMSIVTGQDEIDSRGRAPSRWFEDHSHSGDGRSSDAFKVLERSTRESKYMGLPREARNAPALYGNLASASTSSGQWQPSGASRQPSYVSNQHPPEKTGLHEEGSILPPPPFLPSTPSSAPYTPDPRRLDISRLVTLPPPCKALFPFISTPLKPFFELRDKLQGQNTHFTAHLTPLQTTFIKSDHFIRMAGLILKLARSATSSRS